jgi:hypothetical protein
MNNKVFLIAKFNQKFNKYLPEAISLKDIYQSYGLAKHIEKRHPECVNYLNLIPDIVQAPDYIGVNPNEAGVSFELVKTLNNHIQIGIKLDISGDYLYVATLHTITEAKLQHGIKNGRLKKFDK